MHISDCLKSNKKQKKTNALPKFVVRISLSDILDVVVCLFSSLVSVYNFMSIFFLVPESLYVFLQVLKPKTSEDHYVKSIQIRSFSGPYFLVFEVNTERYSVSLHIQSEYREIRTRINSVFGHFSRRGLHIHYLTPSSVF